MTGDWPDAWKRGLVYDFETLRTTIRPPVGIYDHHWDRMQAHTPRAVLGEAMLDAMCLSYADAELAKEVVYGTFADAPAPNVPCSREDGSVNMVGTDGSKCGTAPIWGLPFHVVDSIYRRDGDRRWLEKLYPHLTAYLEWWLRERTDDEGWFHANNSWESGQDASKRFLVAEENSGAVAEFVRTVDIEAAMAHTMATMERFAAELDRWDDAARWRELAADRVERTRSMFADGWFRDVDGRTGEPIETDGYYVHSKQMF